jgi:hypothetical protein
MKAILRTCLLLIPAVFFFTRFCPAQSADPGIVFIRLNNKIGYIIEPEENLSCNLVPYVNTREFRYAALAQLPDSRVVMKIRLAKSDIYRNVNITETELKQLDSLAAVLPDGKSVLDSKEESELLKEMAGKVPYQMIDYHRFTFPVLPLIAPPKPPPLKPDTIKPVEKQTVTKQATDIAWPGINPGTKLQPVNPLPVPDAPRIFALNVVEVNLLGQGSLFSLNYERFFNVLPKVFWSGKVGIGYNQASTYKSGLFLFGGHADNPTPPEDLITIPIQVTANLGSDDLYFEIGMGGTAFLGNSTRFYPYPILGWRINFFDKVHARVFCNIPLFKEDFGMIFQKGYIAFFPVGFSLGSSF